MAGKRKSLSTGEKLRLEDAWVGPNYTPPDNSDIPALDILDDDGDWEYHAAMQKAPG